MKYFIDTEFIEGTQSKTFCGIKHVETKPTIDLISIGIVSEDGREYYAISKDFNLKEAWNRYDIKQADVTKLVDVRGEDYGVFCCVIEDTDSVKEWKNQHPNYKKVLEEGKLYKDYWIRDNILKPIYEELISLDFKINMLAYNDYPFSYSSMKYLINEYGKTNKQIAEEIKEFCSDKIMVGNTEFIGYGVYKFKDIQFYGYYSDYDWVAFCQLFGKMIDLPKDFPMYCIGLKQTLDEKIKTSWKDIEMSTWGHNCIKDINKLPNYPKQTNKHNALDDAKWNFKLYEFLKSL